MLPRLTFASLVAVAAIATPAAARSKAPRPSGFEPTLPAYPAPARVADGSIFDVSSGYAALIEGNRARRIGDALVIRLIEQTTSAKSVGSKTQRNGGLSITPPTAGLLSFLNPNALKASDQSSFNGQGNATQSSTLASILSVTIAEVRPNGTALVRGEKQMKLSQGDEWIRFSGIVRLSDVSSENVVTSAQVADAHMEYSGKGSIQRAGREGWLSRFFSVIAPF